jgi:cobalt-zinc-cadmium efflux system outer membrane protein
VLQSYGASKSQLNRSDICRVIAMKKIISLIALIAILSGCASRSTKVSTQVSNRIEDRTGHGLNPNSQESGFALPPGISLANNLSEDDAVAIALWNNAAFQTDLSALGFARADLIEAGQLRNPILTLLFPFGPKQLEATANLPLEVFWQRPRRVAAAKVEVERVGESLVQTGLNLVRDVRIAYADLALANERTRITTESVRQRNEIAQIVRARFRDGDISEMETTASQLDAKQAADQFARLQSEAAIAKERLRFLLGMSASETAFDIVASSQLSLMNAYSYKSIAVSVPAASSVQSGNDEVNDLVRQALAARPDLRAAEIAIEAAAKRAKWERSKIVSLSAILDANGAGKEGFEAGPGVAVELPIFNRNKGGITRAEAEIERAARQYLAVRQRIALEVREAYAQLQQSRQALASWRSDILPIIEAEIRTAERAYADGEVAYLFVLETSRKLYDARLQEAEASAALQRATAQLERAVGRKISEKP